MLLSSFLGLLQKSVSLSKFLIKKAIIAFLFQSVLCKRWKDVEKKKKKKKKGKQGTMKQCRKQNTNSGSGTVIII